MFLSEEEAKKKWCPILPETKCMINGIPTGYEVISKCLGSDCMMWCRADDVVGESPYDEKNKAPGCCGIGGGGI